MMENLQDYLYTMHSCNQCGQCKWVLGPKMRGWRYAEVCPIHQRFNFDSYSGQGLINIAQEMLEGRLKYEEGLIRLIYTCLTCGACDVNCKSIRDMEVLDTLLALRAKCVEDGQGPLPEHRELAARIEKCHNIFGKPHDRRFDWVPEGTRLSASSGIAYFAGCSSSYKHPEIAINTLKLLNAAGIEFKILGSEEYCCGVSLWRTGQIDAFRKVVERNLDIFKKQNIRTLITSCAECFGTFRGGYPRFAAMEIETLHITQLIRQVLQEGRLKPGRKIDLKVTYHDPCFLGRLSEKYIPWQGEIQAFGLHVPPKPWRRGTCGIYDAPREILRLMPGIELVEMPRNAENAYCCGAGGGVPSAFPDFARWVAAERLDEAGSTAASALISGCPFCKDSFEEAIKATHSRLRYYDLTELLVKALSI
jgi:Fe-S oxidoreductase